MIDVRLNADGSLDEVLLMQGTKCLFHLEQMDDNHWWMAVYDDLETVHIDLTSTKQIRAGWRKEKK